jgi:hypothetical protein
MLIPDFLYEKHYESDGDSVQSNQRGWERIRIILVRVSLLTLLLVPSEP